MSYHIYTTDGIVLRRSIFGEADIMLHVLTLDFGLILASARSARSAKSKLRFALQEYELVSLSCIKGKNGWKITNVVGKGNFYFESPEYSHKVLARVSKVLLQMIQGESPHPEIFETVQTGFEFLKKLPEKNITAFEILAVLRILFGLGYVVRDEVTEEFLNDCQNWSIVLLDQITIKKEKIVGLINKALKESHL
jgi:DNA repair protein RecO (recombination protein O)